MSITIDNVPIAANPKGHGVKTEFTKTVESLDVDQSFFVDLANSKPQSYLRSKAWEIGERTHRKFSCSKVTENGISGMRISRVK